MTTARDVISLAMRECGVLGVGQTLLAQDVNDGLTLLQNMINQWQKRRWLVPSLYDISTIGNSLKSNKMGSGQFWNTPRPDKIQAGYTIQQNTGGNPVSLPLYPIFSFEDYARITVKELNTVPRYYFYDAAYPYGNLYIWPIPNSSWENHLIIKSQLGFATTIASGTIATAGTGYTNGTYNSVPLQGGSGISATATITVAGGVVTTVVIENGGNDYKVNETLSVLAADVGGTGQNFAWTINSLSSSLDSDMDLPPEYLEAIHYNLALRLTSMYQLSPNDETRRLAHASLNTIQMANTQVPAMQMPAALRKGKGFNIYNADGY